MNRHIITLAGSICFLLMAIGSNGQQSGRLTIEASNFGSDSGKAIVQLFREQDDIPEKPFKQVTGNIIDGKAIIIVSTIPFGEYAAILFHDENSNGVLDHKLGFPNEAMGFSNAWKLSLFSGMPTFKKLKFNFDQVNLNYRIMIR